MILVSRQEIENAAAGDMVAFEGIYRKTSQFVYGVALRMCNDRQEAEEITQDVFMKVHNGLKNFELRSSFKTWIYRIAINTTLNHVKRLSFRKNISFDTLAEHHFSTPTPQAQDQQGQEKIITNMLSVLNPDQRLCMILRHGQQMSYEEIAQTLNVNINTVRTRLKRARQKLFLSRKKGMSDEM